MYMIDGPPFTKDGQGRVFDRRKTEVVPYKPGLEALHEMHTAPEWKGVKVGYASRTEVRSSPTAAPSLTLHTSLRPDTPPT
mmetsp:Transcript_4662/g.15444  ORF Transcript_4662/g.15444 Transcript_4662/m.15444 type:complete len:81 (-) Transcript_4662:844-1086(-)